MFLDILEFTVENKKNILGKMWFQICEKMAYVSTKLILEKSVKTNKLIKTKNNENIYNIWRILGTKLVLLVDFCDHIFKTVFPKQFYLFSTLNSTMSQNMCKWCHKVRNGQNLPHIYISMLFSPISLTPRLAYSIINDRFGYNVGVFPTNRAVL